MPWQTEGEGKEDFKYQYHPGGDKSKTPKDAPSALNTVIVPNVNLPKVKHIHLGLQTMLTMISKSLHDKYNKWGKDGY